MSSRWERGEGRTGDGEREGRRGGGGRGGDEGWRESRENEVRAVAEADGRGSQLIASPIANLLNPRVAKRRLRYLRACTCLSTHVYAYLPKPTFIYPLAVHTQHKQPSRPLPSFPFSISQTS